MSNSPESDSNEKSSGLDQSQGRVPNPSHKIDDNLDSWIDNFLVETGGLEQRDGRGESSDKRLASGEDVSAWADRILSGGSSDEEKGDRSQGHRSDGESDDGGNAHDGDSAITPIKSNGDDDDDQAKENEPNTDSCGNTKQLTPSPTDPNSGSTFLLSMNNDEEEVGEDEAGEKIPEFVPYEPFDNEDSGSEIAVNDKDGEAEKDEDTQHGHDPDATHPLIINDDDDDPEDAKHNEPEEKTLESISVLQFDNDEDSSGMEDKTSESDGESSDDGDGTSHSPLNHRKRSSTLITIISDDDEQTGKHEPLVESMELTPAKPENEDDVSPGMEIVSGEMDIERGNNRDSPNEPATIIPPPRNRRKRSSTSITIDDGEQSEGYGPQGESPDPSPTEFVDNADDYSGMGLGGNTSDWDEIDLNSENEEHDDNSSTSTSGVAPADRETGGSLRGSTDPISPGSIQRRLDNNASYFKTYFNYLYYFGQCPYDGDGKNACGILNFVLFAISILVASLHTTVSIKDAIIFGRKEDILLHFIRIGYDINIFLFRLYHVYLVTFKASSISGIIKAVEDFGGRTSRVEILLSIGSILLSSLLLSLSFPVVITIGSMVSTWDFEDLTLASSEDFATSWLIWKKDGIENSTRYVWDTYGTDITSTVVEMAVLSLIFSIIGFASLILIKDYSLVAALTMYKSCKTFSKELDVTRRAPLTPESCEELWKRYKLLRAFSDQLNDADQFLFQLFHLDNLLFSAYLLFLQFISGGSLLLGILQFCLLAKVIIFYLLAANAATVNEKLDKWSQSSFPGANTKIVENGETLTTNNLRHQLKSNKIGIGRGIFFIDGTFLWKFISIVGSFFIFFTDRGQ